jgi:hypothetical protein
MGMQTVLEEMLCLAYTPEAARLAVARACRAAGLDAPPRGDEELWAFASAYVLPIIRDDHGAALAGAVMEELEHALADLRSRGARATLPPRSAPSRSRLILLVVRGAARARSLSETLTGGNFRVHWTEEVIDLGPPKASPFHGIVAVVQSDAEVTALKDRVEAFGFHGGIVLCAPSTPAAAAIVRDLAAVRLLASDASDEEVLAGVQELLW